MVGLLRMVAIADRVLDQGPQKIGERSPLAAARRVQASLILAGTTTVIGVI
jgi:hypothetical protein